MLYLQETIEEMCGNMEQKLKTIVLAAGKGTRLHEEGVDLPKVMRSVCGKPLLRYVLDALDFQPRENVILVVGYQKEKVTAAFPEYAYVEQTEQLGTGHAVMCARGALEGFDGAVLVTCGDTPLIRRETYEALIKQHFREENACTMLTGSVSDNQSYGRIVRDAAGEFRAIVEDRDCTPEQKAITEVNSGVLVFSAPALLAALGELRTDNAQGEYYLTDVPEILLRQGLPVRTCTRDLGWEIVGVNKPEQLRLVEELLSAQKHDGERAVK